MVILSVKLQKGEIALTAVCFLLPLAGSVMTVYNDLEQIVEIVGMTITGFCGFAIATVLVCLACHSLRRHAIDNNNEEDYLLHERTKRRYQTALKESLPFITYPVMILIWLLTQYLNFFDSTNMI